jgi:hypothetical protein
VKQDLWLFWYSVQEQCCPLEITSHVLHPQTFPRQHATNRRTHKNDRCTGFGDSWNRICGEKSAGL